LKEVPQSQKVKAQLNKIRTEGDGSNEKNQLRYGPREAELAGYYGASKRIVREPGKRAVKGLHVKRKYQMQACLGKMEGTEKEQKPGGT